MEVKYQLKELEQNYSIISGMGEQYLEMWKSLCMQYADILNQGPAQKSTAFTLHDFCNHCAGIYKLLQKMPLISLTQEELFILNVSVLLHDYSMSQENFNRKKHSDESAKLVQNMYGKDGIWDEVSLNHQEIIPLVLLAHSDTKDDDGKVLNMENAELTDSMQGNHINPVRAKYLAGVLRLADSLDITRERLGRRYSNQLPKLDCEDENQKESLRHWKRLRYFKNVEFKESKIYLTINDKFSFTKEDSKEEVLEQIKQVRVEVKDELDYLNKVVFSGYTIFALDVEFNKSQLFSKEELSNDNKSKIQIAETASEKSQEHNAPQEKELVINNNVTPTSLKQNCPSNEEIQSDNVNRVTDEKRCFPLEWGAVEIIDGKLEKKVTEYILKKHLIYSGHYRMNHSYCGKDWIDVRQILRDRNISFSIVDALAQDIRKLKDFSINNTIIVGVSMNGNIMASRIGFLLHVPFTYVLPTVNGERGSISERNVNLNNYSNIILVTGVISTCESIKQILKDEKINAKVKKIYTILYRSICENITNENLQFRKRIKAINAKFNADIILKRDCMLIKNNRCIAENLAAFNQVVDENGNWNHDLKLVYGNSNRIFLNVAIGCEANCSYCYLNDLVEKECGVWQYSVHDVLEHLKGMENFRLGKMGTILSLGCYSECWSENNKKTTQKLICVLAESENPIQMATKKQIVLEDLLDIDSHLKYEGQLTIYVSIPTVSHSEEYEAGTDCVTKRISNFSLQYRLKKIKFAIYIRPVLENVTINDIEHYQQLMTQYNLPCIVGDFLRKKTDGEWIANMVGEGHLEEEKVADVDFIMKELKQYGSVYRHSTELIEDMRNKKFAP